MTQNNYNALHKRLSARQAKKMRLKRALEEAVNRVAHPFNIAVGTAEKTGVNGVTSSGAVYYRKPNSRISLPFVGQVAHGDHP